MNRSAYSTAGFAIKALSRLSKANIVIHGKENIPSGPNIFVINHFTRLETILLPSYIYSITDKPVWSLAAAPLFSGGLGKFLDLVGAVSTRDPDRDELIVKSLLTGEADWIIFPEGSMVKTKKIMKGGKFMVAGSKGVHEPHTGAAALALRSELFRHRIFELSGSSVPELGPILESLKIKNLDEIQPLSTTIIPVNITYYPIRAMENIASTLAAKYVKDMPERMVEEIMTEGTMLLSGVDLDIRFGNPIEVVDYLEPGWVQDDIQRDGIDGYSLSAQMGVKMRKTAYEIMHRYMADIYAMTTVNQEHLYASILRMYPFEKIKEDEFRRRVFYAATLIDTRGNGDGEFFLHKSLKESQTHLLTNDRYKKYDNFLKLAQGKGVVKKSGSYLIRDRTKLSVSLSFHKGRIDNPIEIIANEVEPLAWLQKLMRVAAWLPPFLIKFNIARYYLKKERGSFVEAVEQYGVVQKERRKIGKPYLLPSFRRKLGVVLLHSYLAVPQEVKKIANHLQRKGYWVYSPRLPGHGTSPVDLHGRKYEEWLESVESGFAMMSNICDRVVVGGVAVGGSLALNIASRIPDIAGVFAVCPLFSLKNYSTNFMPSVDVWHRMLNKMKGEGEKQFLDFTHGNPHVNYLKNPVNGVKEVGEFLDYAQKMYSLVKQPALILQANKDPVVDPSGAKEIYDLLESAEKEFCLMSFDRNVVVDGEGAGVVLRRISDFIKSV